MRASTSDWLPSTSDNLIDCRSTLCQLMANFQTTFCDFLSTSDQLPVNFLFTSYQLMSHFRAINTCWSWLEVLILCKHTKLALYHLTSRVSRDQDVTSYCQLAQSMHIVIRFYTCVRYILKLRWLLWYSTFKFWSRDWHMIMTSHNIFRPRNRCTDWRPFICGVVICGSYYRFQVIKVLNFDHVTITW